MKPILKYFFASLLSLGVSAPAFASNVFLVGDNNIDTTLGDNEILFQNILNGQNVLNDSALSLGGLGTTANITNASITGANLAAQNILVTGFGKSSYSATELDDISTFVTGGGSLFLVGEYNPNFSLLNTSINEILSLVGSGMSLSLTENLIGAGVVDLVNVTNNTPFGAGVNAWHTGGAQSLLLLGLNGQAVVSGQDPRPCDTNGNPICVGVGRIGAVVAYEMLNPIPVPAAVWLFGTALIGLVGFGKRRKAA